jgi:hypothetical protein
MTGPVDAQHTFVEHLLSLKYDGVDTNLLVTVIETIGNFFLAFFLFDLGLWT